MEFGARKPGEHVVLREVFHGKTWTLRPVTVVSDTPETTVLFMPHGVSWRGAVTMAGEILRVPWEPWEVAPPKLWENHYLRISVPGEDYSIAAIWHSSWRMFGWYLNIEEALRPTQFGFDYMDWTLDVFISRDRRFHTWKDEEELEEAVRRGVYSPELAVHIREAGERGLARLLAGESPFDEAWQDWRPDPGWTLPQLPEHFE
ncbi:MAG: DUF402 domain-containing protein [Chloroflexota bacterium]